MQTRVTRSELALIGLLASVAGCSTTADNSRGTMTSSVGPGGASGTRANGQSGVGSGGGSGVAGSSNAGGSGGVSGGGGGGSPGIGGSSGAGGRAIDGGAIDAGGDAGPLWGPGANYPYVLTNYDEPYRGQVHFTAPMGWLNDVNGVWYLNGVYHLGYQAYPYALDQGPKHWGHATSTDLVHWTHWPIMLDPTLVPGDVWSGSTVVDVNNTSGFKTGANPVLVSMYTATSRGTCIAYSNDLGLTWQAYAGNPVAIGGPNADTRDPHLFWHEPTQKWVTAHYDGGAAATAFYTSSDLKNWTRTSRIAFGFECPDIYELPIDGVSTNTKWVLQDGSGSYLLGQFDGATFVPDSTVPKRMDMSPGFYAAQTFFRPTLPDARLVQMGWIRALDTTASGSPSFGTTAPFNQALTFPAEVKLVTFPDGVRAARTPVAEIQNLYGTPVHFDAQVAVSGANPFAALTSKVFDLEVTIDLAQTTATTITFRASNLTFPLAVSTRQLFGATVSPINNRVKIRVLRDWGQYEVFANDGQVAYSQGFAFNPADASVSMTGNGTLAIVAADFRPLNRAWPGTAASSSVILDDTDVSTTYAGAWNVATETRYFRSTARVGAAGASFQTAFTGTRVEWYGLKNVDLGKADVFLDGTMVAIAIDAYSTKRQSALLFTKGGLVRGPHTLRVVANGQRNAASTGVALVHDYVVAYLDP